MKAGARTMQGEAARQKVMSFMRTFEKEHGYVPNVSEIAAGTGMFRNAVRFHLERLRQQGKVAFTDGVVSRTLRVP